MESSTKPPEPRQRAKETELIKTTAHTDEYPPELPKAKSTAAVTPPGV